jgi:hypothetical protein
LRRRIIIGIIIIPLFFIKRFGLRIVISLVQIDLNLLLPDPLVLLPIELETGNGLFPLDLHSLLLEPPQLDVALPQLQQQLHIFVQDEQAVTVGRNLLTGKWR